MTRTSQALQLSRVRALLCDADGTLFASEEPAFTASATVTNAFLASMGVSVRLTPEELRKTTTGQTFRATAVDLCVAHGVRVVDDLLAGHTPGMTPGTGGPRLTRDLLEHWIGEERRHVSTHLAAVLRPDRAVIHVLTELGKHLELAVVTNSAIERLDACLAATGLAPLFAPTHRFSAEDSLSEPTSKPDPAVYAFAGDRIGCRHDEAIAVEDSVPGARSAVAAGFQTIGMLEFLPGAERVERAAGLRRAGAVAVVSSWHEIADLLLPTVAPEARAG